MLPNVNLSGDSTDHLTCNNEKRDKSVNEFYFSECGPYSSAINSETGNMNIWLVKSERIIPTSKTFSVKKKKN